MPGVRGNLTAVIMLYNELEHFVIKRCIYGLSCLFSLFNFQLGIGRKKRSQQKNGIFATLCRSDSLLERCKLKVPSRPQMDIVSGEEFSNVLPPEQLLIECAAQLDLNDETPALERLLYHWTQFHRTAELLLNYNCKGQRE